MSVAATAGVRLVTPAPDPKETRIGRLEMKPRARRLPAPKPRKLGADVRGAGVGAQVENAWARGVAVRRDRAGQSTRRCVGPAPGEAGEMAHGRFLKPNDGRASDGRVTVILKCQRRRRQPAKCNGGEINSGPTGRDAPGAIRSRLGFRSAGRCRRSGLQDLRPRRPWRRARPGPGGFPSAACGRACSRYSRRPRASRTPPGR